MNTTEILKRIKQTFEELTNAEVVAPETAPEMIVPTKAKLKDGTEIEVSEMGVGGIVTIQGVPAPIGEHELEDGTIIVVGDNGAIVEIKPSMTQPPMVEDMGAKFSAFQNSTNEKFAAYETKFAAYEEKFADYESKLKKSTSMIEGLIQLTQTLAEQPTGVADSSIKATNNFTEVKKKNYSILFN
jgi:spore coat protein CotH